MMSPGKPDVDPNSSSKQDISETSTLSGTQDIYEPVPVPPKLRNTPTNYLRVDKKRVPICGQYFIDASIPPVPKTVPYVVAGTENLLLRTTTGSVIADVWVTGNNKLRRVSMELNSQNDDVQAEVHDAFSSSESESRPSLDIVLWAHGSVFVSLPRCFRGLVIIQRAQGAIVFSPALEERTTLLSDVEPTRVYFVGDRPRAWMSWRDDDDKGGQEAPEGASISPEEPLDKISVSHWGPAMGIRWDGELKPEFPV